MCGLLLDALLTLQLQTCADASCSSAHVLSSTTSTTAVQLRAISAAAACAALLPRPPQAAALLLLGSHACYHLLLHCKAHCCAANYAC
jgi:hypothetical protein